MRMLVLGGTQWIGREIARTAAQRGHEVVCLARGDSGQPPDGVRFVAADRWQSTAYDAVAGEAWDEVVDVNWQPGMVRSAVAALSGDARHWTYVSSCSVYASHAEIGADEGAATAEPLEAETAGIELYDRAKVACEDACRGAVGERLLVARAGLISGPGDHTDRTGYWAARAARAPEDPLLVPAALDQPSQVIDVRDLVSWLVGGAESGLTGTYNAVGPVETLGDWIMHSRQAGSHTADVVAAPPEWLLAQGVQEWAGEESLPLWIAEPGWAGFGARSNAAASAAGLRHRPRADVARDVLAWEREQGLGRPRRAGLSPARERALLDRLSAEG